MSATSGTPQRGIAQHASALYNSTNAICWEMERYYKQNANYAATYREMYEIKEVAKRLKATVEQQNNRSATADSRIVSALHDMDRRFHEFGSDVSRWRPTSGHSPQRLLTAMIGDGESQLHSVMNDYGLDTRYHQAARSRADDSDRNNRIDRDPRSRSYPGR